MDDTHAIRVDAIAEQILLTLESNGPLWSLQHEWCSQAFQQAHAVRAMLACHRLSPRDAFLSAAAGWAEMTLRLQGTAGHPDAFNMGYGYQIDRGVPSKWYVADCGTIAVTLLDIASLLGFEDSRSQRYLVAVRRFADYIIERWSLPDGSFALGYDAFQCLNDKPYHCAVQQSNLFLWPLAKITGEAKYHDRATETARWMAHDLDFDSSYYGSAIHNRGYGGESMLVAMAHLDENQGELCDALDARLRDIAQWSTHNFGGTWFRNETHSHAKDPLLLMVLQACRNRWDDLPLDETVDAGYAILQDVLADKFEVVRKHRLEGLAVASCAVNLDLKTRLSQPKFFVTDGLTGMALAVRQKPGALFPLCLPAGAVQ